MNKLKEANKNSFPAQRWIWEVYEVPCQEMSYGTKTVAGVIALCAWGEKDHSKPGYESISVALGGASRATIAKAIKELQDRGFIAITKQPTKAGLHNEYRLTFPNSLDTEHIKCLDTKQIDSKSSVSSSNVFSSEANVFSFDDQSVHTGELEALIEPLIEASSEAIDTEDQEEPGERLDEDTSWTSIPLDKKRSGTDHSDLDKAHSILRSSKSSEDEKDWAYGVISRGVAIP